MTYKSAFITFIETPTFTSKITDLLSDSSYSDLQRVLADNPQAGKLISGTGGLRKIRWVSETRGKRGGLRVIYYWHSAEDVIDMLLVYAKNEQEELTPMQIKLLRSLIKEDK